MGIKIEAETLRANANTLHGYKETHDANIQAVQNLIRSVCNTEAFDGQTASAYLARMESFQGQMNAFSEMLEDFSLKMKRAADEFESYDASLAGSIS